MSFLKRLFGHQEQIKKEKIPRAPRIGLSGIHQVLLTSPSWHQQLIKVINISTTGLALERNNVEILTDHVFLATLTIRNRTFPVRLKVAHLSQELIGCSFEGEIGGLQQAIKEHFIAEISGMEVTEINAKLLKPDSRGDPKWFFSSNNSEVYLTIKNERITYFHVALLGNYIESYEDQAPRFGYIVTQEGSNKMKPDQSPLIRYTNDFPKETIQLVKKFVSNIESLNQVEKTFILTVLDEVKPTGTAKS